MYRALLAAAVVPLALGDYSYSYDAPTAAELSEGVLEIGHHHGLALVAVSKLA